VKSNVIACTVPDERQAAALRKAVEGEVSSEVPASIPRKHASTAVFLDGPAASLLT